ncbi:trypsin-like peptidase domain-containing protein, partial [Streptomyces albidus (ex Kaewkla and Franco 2022)]|uniref:trypsin-like peptidase domain-containing protein n=1 Tax=Streptomyces albidus (ex Kaewkla and Franco 2022) TaxID=722709 RepID=UPI001F44A42C
MWDRAASVEYAGRIGVGCVIAPGVILTTRHVVEQSAGAGDEPRMVRVLSNGTDGPRARAEVAWRRGEVALLRCRPRELGQEFSPVRWGELTCTKPPVPPECSAVGLPNAGLREIGSGRDDRTFQEPHTAPVRIDIVDNTSRTYGLQLDRRPLQHVQGTEAAAWQGMAGAAVFCSDLLMGMVTHAGGGRHGRLEAVPARQLLEDRVFCDIVEDASGMRPRLEAADLDGLFDGLPQPVAAASYLLSPRSEVVDFVGLDSEVTTLTDWCSTPRSVDVAVVHGAGGVGKTRLGVELARRLSERRPEAEYHPDGPDVSWTAGFLSEIQPQHAPPYGMFRFLTRPALIVIDHAEFRLEQVEQLLNAVSEHQAHGRRIRVLLLAHSTGSWWERLQVRHGHLISGMTIPIEPDALYRHHTPAQVQELAEIDFSKRIVALHRAGVRDDWDGYQAADERAARAAAADRNGDTAIPGTVINDHRGALSVHMEALTSVLLNTPGELTDTLPASVTLLDHEMNYVRRGAGEHGFHDSDPDLLRALVALQGMAGAQDKEEADSVIETAWNFHFRDDPRPLDLGTHQKMRRTIGGLYPALGMGASGDLGPDVLTSALIERLEADSDSAFLRHVLPSPSLSARQRRHSLALIARSIATRPRLADGAAHAIASHPLILAVPATKIAEQLREPVREVWLKSIGNAAARREHQQRADGRPDPNVRRERERPRAAPTSGGPAPRTTVPAATGPMTGTASGTAMPPPAP